MYLQPAKETDMDNLREKVKYIASTVLITFGVYTLVHLINVTLNQYFIAEQILNPSGAIVQVNYMFSIFHDYNPLLMIFYNLIPYEFWYMLLCIPVAVVYLAALYGIYEIYKTVRYGKNGEKIKK